MQQMILVWISFLLMALSTGCGQSDISVYRVPKAEPSAAPQTAKTLPAGHPDIPQAASPLKWTLPAGWEEVSPGEMRVASFRVNGSDGKQVDVSIVPLPGMAGGNLANVNRWRKQVGLADLTEEELSRIAQPVEIAGLPGQLYEQAGKISASGTPARILGAIQNRAGTAWFFKMTGDDELVNQQKPLFIEFLKSLSWSDSQSTAALSPSHPPGDSAAAGSSNSEDGKPQWQVPPGWHETSGGQFLVAKFLISGPDDSHAAVNVSITGGGLAANVNRWRGQLGLPSFTDADLQKQLQPLELPSAKAMLIDMAGTEATTKQNARLIGIVVSQADRTWYYKLMGHPQLVEREKEAFINFVKSAAYK